MRVDRSRADLAVDDPVGAVTVAVHRPARPRGRALLLVHGAGGDLDQPRLVALADAVAAAGHVVVRANLPYRQAGRARAPAAERSVHGLAATLAAVRAAEGPRRGWVLGGASYGGRVATLAVAAGEVDVDGVVCVGYPLRPPWRPEALRVDHWPRVDVPVLLVQGTRDRFGGPQDLAPHLGSITGGALVHAVAGADHGLLLPGVHAPDGVRRLPPEVAARVAPAVVGFLAAPAASTCHGGDGPDV